jgi:hypothetical protein
VSRRRVHNHPEGNDGSGGGNGGGCDPSYPNVCIPPPPLTWIATMSRSTTSRWSAQTRMASKATTTASVAKRESIRGLILSLKLEPGVAVAHR